MGYIQFNGTPEEWDALVKKNKEQKTLEEAAEKYLKEKEKDFYSYEVKDGFIDGAKWQQERMYSEEEVLELLLNRPGPYLSDEEIKEWFEQFKSK
jgi:hypothetical protein